MNTNECYQCIECGNSVSQIYVTYGQNNIKMMQCTNMLVNGNRCDAFVDKYVEFDAISVFIDIILLKTKAYRHMIFNGVEYSKYGLNANLLRLAILLNLFEVYMKWIKKEQDNNSFNDDLPVHTQYLYVLTQCVSEFIAFHLSVRFGTFIVSGLKLSTIECNRLSMAIILSSFGKMILIVMVIWDYGVDNPSLLINLFVLSCNYCAISGS
jgi:hypothetical protein